MSSSPEASAFPHLWAVILAGGIGTRFWPASTPSRPKQLLPLASNRPLIRDTVDRIKPLVPTERIRILTGKALAEPLLRTLPEIGPGNLLLEPRAAGTAPILAWAAAEIERRDPDAVMISLHADHVIDPAEAFRARLAHSAKLASAHRLLFTLGARITRPETGYGYIRVGSPLDPAGDAAGAPGYRVDSFVEKPDAPTARAYLESGDYLWNTGLFVWRVADLLDQLEQHTPELAELVPILREGGVEDVFDQIAPLSIDDGLLERSDRVGVLPADFHWDDVGAWDALTRTHPADAAGNVVVGDALAVEAGRSILYSEEGPIVAFGVEDLVVVRASGITFVTRRDRIAELKTLHAQLPDALRTLE